jgi:predicted DsbA family dithiol-disulfide isomerase
MDFATITEAARSKRSTGYLGGGLLVGALMLAVGLSSCSKGPDKAQAAPAASSSAEKFPDVLATIGDERITMKDVREKAGDDLERIETQYHQMRSRIVKDALDAMLREKVLDAEAKKQGKTLDQLIVAEAGGSLEPTDVEITTWYNANQARTGGRSVEQIRSQITDFLRGEKKKAAEKSLEERLNRERKVVINFQPYRLSFQNEGAPSLGKEGAAVTLVEFSDFQCPFCHRFAPTLKQVEEKFGDKVHVVYRQYPLTSIHPFAFKAAEASLCAHEQGKFWEMHDILFAEQEKLAVTDLKAKAGRIGLNQKKFDTCLDTGRYVEQIQKDMKEGTRVGVTGTPAVFINGAELKGGAVPYETVAEAIQQELARNPKTN